MYSAQNLTSFVEGMNLLVENLGLIKVGRLSESLASCSLRSSQPGSELLDASLVLGPELDILGVLVALGLNVLLEVLNIVLDSVEFVLEFLGVLWNLLTLRQQILFFGNIGPDNL